MLNYKYLDKMIDAQRAKILYIYFNVIKNNVEVNRFIRFI